LSKIQPYQLLIICVLATVAMVIYAQFVLGYYSECYYVDGGPNSIGLSFLYSSEDVSAFLNIRNHQQIECYLTLLKIWDNIFPLIYTAVNLLWIRLLFPKSKWLLIIPLIHMLLDWIENYLQIEYISSYLTSGTPNVEMIPAASIITAGKWIAASIAYLIILSGTVIWLVNKLRKKVV
jgi:hypothetical protein